MTSSATTLPGAMPPTVGAHVVVDPAQFSRGEIAPALCGRRGTRRRAALLLEVVVALTILVVALAVLGGQLSAGIKLTGQAEQQTRASQLADRIMSLVELDQTILQRVFANGQADGDFGDQYPGWFWRVALETTDVPGLGAVTVQVLFEDDPKKSEQIEEARIVKQLHMLKADPGRINLETDFGVDATKMEELAAMIPIPGFDPTAIDPQAIVSLDPMQLLEMLPALMPLLQQMQFGGGGMPGGGGNLPPGLAGLLGGGAGNPFAGAGGAGALSNNFLRDFIRQQAGGKISDEQIDQALSGMGGGRPGGGAGGGPADDGAPPQQTPDRNGFTRDSLREMLKGALGDQVSDAELEEALDAYERGQGGGNAGGGGSPADAGGFNRGNRGNGSRGEGNDGNRGNRPQRINDLNDRRTGRGGAT